MPKWNIRKSAGTIASFRKSIFSLLFPFFILLWPFLAWASSFPFNTSNSVGNIGIGTSTPGGTFIIMPGNVGIGTWIPDKMLDIIGGIHASGNVGIGTTTPQAAFVVTNGNVGIGTWAPVGAALSVMNGNVGIGGATAPNALLELRGPSGNTQSLQIAQTGVNGWYFNNMATTGDLRIGSTNSEGKVTILTGGNVGIGSTAPGTLLDVSGRFRAGGTSQNIQSYSPSGGGTATLDLSLGNLHFITMPAGNITIALSNAVNGQVFMVRILQDSVGSRTVTWFTTIKWAGGTAPTLTTTASKADVLGFVVTSSGNYDGFVIGQNI